MSTETQDFSQTMDGHKWASAFTKDLHMTPDEQKEAARLSIETRDKRWEEVGDEDDLFDS